MSDKSKIEWTDASWNPVRARNRRTGGIGHFCIHHSPGCLACYAERMQPRFNNPIRYRAPDQELVEVFLDPVKLADPLRWRRPRMIFVCSMTDLFGSWVSNEWIAAIYGVVGAATQHSYQVLTKRPDRALDWFKWVRRTAEAHGTTPAGVCRHHAQQVSDHPALRDSTGWDAWTWPPRNAWTGVSAEDQRWADGRIPILLEIPSAVRFVSLEPLLGPITDTGARWKWQDINWIVVGGESGPNARPCDVAWIRGIVQAGSAAGSAVYVKQLGSRAIISTKSDHRGRAEAASPLGTNPESPTPWRLWLSDAKGGGSDMSEWPDDLRIRLHPQPRPSDVPPQPALPAAPGTAAARD